MSMGQNPYAPGSPGMAPGGMAPPEVGSKANTVWWLGILSIPTCCCPIVGIILGVVALVMAGGATTLAQQYNAQEALSKISTGKTCAIIGIVLSVINAVVGVIINVMGAMNQ